MKRFAIYCLICALLIGCSNIAIADTLKKGSKGDDVKSIQERLIELGYLDSSADGDFGGKTEKAVKEFQTEMGMDPSGIVDDNTLSMLMGENATSKPYILPYGITFGMSFDQITELLDPVWKEVEIDPSYTKSDGNLITPMFLQTDELGTTKVVSHYRFDDDKYEHLNAVLYRPLHKTTKDMYISWQEVHDFFLNNLGDEAEYYDYNEGSISNDPAQNASAIEDGSLILTEHWRTNNIVVEHFLYKFDDGQTKHQLYVFERQEGIDIYTPFIN